MVMRLQLTTIAVELVWQVLVRILQIVPEEQLQVVRFTIPIAFKIALQLIWQAEPFQRNPDTQLQAVARAEELLPDRTLAIELQLKRMEEGTQKFPNQVKDSKHIHVVPFWAPELNGIRLQSIWQMLPLQ